MLSPERIQRYDSDGMLEELDIYPDMCLQAYKEPEIDLEITGIENIVVAGMGGSAIGGYMLKQLLREKSRLPIQINRDYNLPEFVDEKTLLLTVSYSGNTQETLSALKDGLNKNCRAICFTSNGELEKIALQKDLEVVKAPEGLQPRAAFPYLFLPLIKVLEKTGLIKNNDIQETHRELLEIKKRYGPETPFKENKAKKTAKKLDKTIPVIYGYRDMEPVAYRWKCQINENAKKFSIFNKLPELNHNEVVGWQDPLTKNMSVCILKEKKASERAEKLIKATENTFNNAKHNIQIEIPGNTPLTRMLSGVYIGDYISVYLAALNKVNPTPVKPIEKIKQKLEKMEKRK